MQLGANFAESAICWPYNAMEGLNLKTGQLTPSRRLAQTEGRPCGIQRQLPRRDEIMAHGTRKTEFNGWQW